MPDETGKEKQSASPYSTGGGGVDLEHCLGALLLTRLLTTGPVTALDDRAPERVAFQQGPAALADDIVVTTPAPDRATTLRLDIAVRRAPQFIRSHQKTRELVTTLVRADLAAERSSDENVEHRIAVAVSVRRNDAQELAELAAVARNQSIADDFEKLIRTPGKFKLTSRLDHLTDMVATALDVIGDDTAGTKQQRTWRLLQRLRIWQVDLEEGHEDDWTRLVGDLRPVAVDNTQEEAVALRDRLARLSADLAHTAASLDGPTLRRRLHGHLSPAAHAGSSGWRRLTALDKQARATVTRTLATGGPNELLLPRTSARGALRAALQTSDALLVVGDSGVGKSALVMDAIAPDQLGGDAQALTVNLRHLPKTPAELLRLFDGSFGVLLGEMTAPQRILVVDAAEAAAEDHADVLTILMRAARNDGARVVAVSTTEGSAVVKDLLRSGGNDPVEHVVGGLDEGEVAAVAEHFPALQRLASNGRGRELLRRPIVVDLLRSAGDPGLPLSEAQALDHIWRHLVRNQERRLYGMPDARQDVMLRLADHAIRGGGDSEMLARLDHEAVDGLRRSGLLQSASPLPWARVPEFRHDLLRSYSIARLLLADADPAAELAKLHAPRWTLPSARLACEILLAAPDDASLPRAGRLQRLQASFDALAAAGHGERWADVPSEALLLAPEAKAVLEDAWSQLVENRAAGVARLIRLLNVRHRRGGLIDTILSEPVIAHLIDAGTPAGVAKEASAFTTDWLQALVLLGAPAGNAIRIRLRDAIVAECGENERALDERDAARAVELAARTEEQVAHDEEERKRLRVFASTPSRRRRRRPTSGRRPYEWIDDDRIEQLGLLGPDLGSDGEAILRRIANDDPYKLERAVEVLGAGHSLASYSTDLLAELALAYYKDERDDDDFGGFGYSGLGDDGIRDHRFYGLQLPLAHLSKGPFVGLFRADYRRGVRLLNELLDHAARYRVERRSGYDSDYGSDQQQSGTVLSICGQKREYFGDSQVWLWYRGTGVGPYPCMSALQALELVTEEIIRLGVPPQMLTAIMLEDAHNLAMPALALAVLVRHLEVAGDALDAFLVEPVIWQLEFGRSTHEHSGLAAHIPDIANAERRRWNLREVSMMLALRADEDRAATLKRLGAHLEAAAREQVGDGNSPAAQQHLAAARNWARSLDRDAYEMTRRDDELLIQQAVDPEVERVLGETNLRLRRTNDAVGLTVRHAHVRDNGGRAPDIDGATLAADLALARDLWADPPRPDELAADGPVAVAASTVELHLSARAVVSDDDLLWSAQVLLQVAAGVGERDVDEIDDSLFSQGADRSAARALPYLLLPAAATLRTALGVTDVGTFAEVVRLSGTLAVDGSNEARLAYARGLDTVWAEPCDTGNLFGTCHHVVALGLVTESFLRCRFGEWDCYGRRSVIELEPRGAEGLTAVDGQDLLVRRLTPALRATGAAAASSACCAGAADAALRPLLDAHRRGMLEHDGFHHSDSDALVAARAALTQAAAGRDDVLLEHVAGFVTRAKILAEALRAVCVAAEESVLAGDAAQRLWPAVMDLVLNAAETSDLFTERTWGDYAEAALIPNPSAEWGYLTLELASGPLRWRDLLVWTPQVDRWLDSITGSRMALDHLVIAVGELEAADQVDQGLRWIERAVERAGVDCASTYTLPEWLRDHRGDLRGEEQSARWQRVVDLLVVAGDTRVSDIAD